MTLNLFPNSDAKILKFFETNFCNERKRMRDRETEGEIERQRERKRERVRKRERKRNSIQVPLSFRLTPSTPV